MKASIHHLTPDETRAIFSIFDREAPTLRPLAEQAMGTQVLHQTYFRRHRVLRVQLISVMPPKVLYFYSPIGRPSDLVLLSVHIERIEALVHADAPFRITDAETASRYAEHIDEWTRDSPYGELVLSHFREIPFYPNPDEVDQILIETLRDTVGPRIEPIKTLQVKDGFVYQKWLVDNRRLSFRQIHVKTNGLISRHEQVIYDEIPCPQGRAWSTVDGRLVPVG